MSASVCVTVSGGRKYFDFHFFLLGLHIASLRQQPINETSRSFPEKDAYHATTHEQAHAFCPLLCSAHTHAQTSRLQRHMLSSTCTCRDTIQQRLSAFTTSREPRVCQLVFAWSDHALTICIFAGAAASSSSSLYFVQQACKAPLATSTSFSLCSSAFVYMSPLPPQLCSSDGWCINGTCAE